MKSLLDALPQIALTEDYVLAIILNTEGSTYRKTGAMMLVDKQLNYWGLLSGGCLEGDIQQHCAQVFSEQKDQQVRYDMRGENDLVWGLGLGCDGALQVLLKYLPARQSHYDFFAILKQVALGNNYLMGIDTSEKYTLNFSSLKKRQADIEIKEILFSISQMPLNSSETSQLLVPMIAPPHILICGAAPDVSPVCDIANQLGWKTTVIDHRADFVQAQHFRNATQTIHIKRSQWNDFPLAAFDAAVIMSHQFERDSDYLKQLLTSDIPYIGLLGPSKRRDQLLSECQTAFAQHEGRVYGPVGLDIGADSPETIALAIISEIQAVKSAKQVGFCYQDSSR